MSVGRWTLMGCPLGRIVVTDGPSTLGIGEETPVVPCDDAAVERAARSIMRSFKDAVAQSDSAGSGELDFRDVARRAFRAAGETP